MGNANWLAVEVLLAGVVMVAGLGIWGCCKWKSRGDWIVLGIPSQRRRAILKRGVLDEIYLVGEVQASVITSPWCTAEAEVLPGGSRGAKGRAFRCAVASE